jgi:hypothetical protein
MLSVLILIQPVAAKLESETTLPANTQYAGYFDFDFDKTPESFYYADGTFYVMNSKGEEIGSFEPKYPKIYDAYSYYYKDDKNTGISFGDVYNSEVFAFQIEKGKLKIIEHETYGYNEGSGNIGTFVIPSDLKSQAFYFGEALMNTPKEFENGTAKARYEYFQTETYRNSEDTNRRVLFADVIGGKPVMVEAYAYNVYYNGEDITPEDYADNPISSFYRVENQIATSGISGISSVFIFRMSENGITESEISHLGNGLIRPDPKCNEYYLTNPMEFDGGFNFSYGGRVFKDYCYYKTEDGSYREYGGIDVPTGNFLSLDGMIDFISPYLEGEKILDAENNLIINNVQWRENNTFTVNFIELRGEYSYQYYLVFRYENGECTEIDTFAGYSEYSQSAEYREDVATYPDTYPGNQGVTWQH